MITDAMLNEVAQRVHMCGWRQLTRIERERVYQICVQQAHLNALEAIAAGMQTWYDAYLRRA